MKGKIRILAWGLAAVLASARVCFATTALELHDIQGIMQHAQYF